MDVGLKNDGLVHKSQLADHYVTDPFSVVTIGQQVMVKVVGIDRERQRVQLSMKTGNATPRADVARGDRPVRSAVAGASASRAVKSGNEDSESAPTLKSNISWR